MPTCQFGDLAFPRRSSQRFSCLRVLEPKLPNHATVKKADAKAKRGYKESFDRRNGTRELPPLQPGDWVRTKLDNEKQWTAEAKVVSKDQSPRSYIIDTGGLRLRRNHRFLRKAPTPACHDTQEDDSLITDISSEENRSRKWSEHP